MAGATTGPLDCSGAGSLVLGGSGACTGSAAAARGLTFSAVDVAGSGGGSEGSIGLAGSEGCADWWTTLSSFMGLSDSTGVEAVTGSFVSKTGGTGAAAGVLGLQSLVEEVW